MKIGVIEGSLRPGSTTGAVARWILKHAPAGAELVHLPLTEYPLPLFDWEQHPMAANRQYPNAQVQAWADAANECDAFIFIAPEYNHGVSGVLKNAIDWLGPELWEKASACIGIGADGGPRSVEHLRQILANFNQHVVRAQVGISIFLDLADGEINASEQKEKDLDAVFGQLVDAAARFQR